jgi:hypothetical protein
VITREQLYLRHAERHLSGDLKAETEKPAAQLVGGSCEDGAWVRAWVFIAREDLVEAGECNRGDHRSTR